MKRTLDFLFAFFLFSVSAAAQTPSDTSANTTQDTIPVIGDTLPAIITDTTGAITPADTFSVMPPKDTGWKLDPVQPSRPGTLSWQILGHHPYFGFNAEPEMAKSDQVRQTRGKDLLFYALVFLLLVYALLRTGFPKYFNDLFRLFFRTTLKQRQISEQLIQTPLPSLLLNGFFVISAAMYISFVLQHYGMNPLGNFWLLVLYCCIGLSAVYFIKFIGLKLSGWVFNMKDAADSYIFIVFVINKMLGILLLPFLVLLAFTEGNVYTVAYTLSLLMVAGLLGYRFVLTYASIRNQVSVNPFHFFLYLCAFEIAPLLLIYKGLLVFFTLSA